MFNLSVIYEESYLYSIKFHIINCEEDDAMEQRFFFGCLLTEELRLQNLSADGLLRGLWRSDLVF
jgi:hypothetical protein